jgi:two-component system NarL family sensor kinase
LMFKVKVFEKKIDAEKKAKIIAQQKNELNRSRNFTLSLAALVLSIVITFWIISLRRKRKQAVEEQLKQEQFTFQLLQNTEEERSRIAGELHDSVNQDLLTMKHNVLNGNQVVAEDFTKVIQEVRNISRNLHPSILENLGLEVSIEHLCEKLTDVGLFTTCEIEYDSQLTKNKELQIYRIIQEALNNTLKHGKANAAKVILTINAQFLHLEIKDNGNGFDVDQQLKNPQSFGLQSILQRAKAIAGKININSSSNGTVILIKIPV